MAAYLDPSLAALGDKIGSTIIAQSAGVPTISWNGDGLTASYATHGRIPQEIYDKANVTTVQQAVETCAKVGFPLMIKASEGGGGKVGKPDAVKNLPFFIGCGKQDFALRGAKLMNDSLTAVNGPVTFKEYDDIEHLAIVQEAARDVFAFFDKLAAKPK